MSNPVDVSKADGFTKACTRITAFRTPLCKPNVDFNVVFKSSVGYPDSAKFVQTLTQTRNEMSNLLMVAAPNENKIKSVDVYLYNILRLWDAINADPKIQLDREMVFEWRGSIDSKADFSKSPDVLFEIIMVLHTKAMLHAITARALVDVDAAAFLSDAGKNLLEASSIMSFLATNIGNGTWKKQFNKRAPNPPEVCEQTCQSLAILFKGQAQAMSFMKTTTAGSTPATIKARLAVGVVNSFTGAFDTLCSIPEAPVVHADLLTQVHITRQLYSALAYMYAAQNYLEKTEAGNAIAFCMQAKLRLLEQKSSVRPTWSAPGLPKFTGPNVDLGLAAASIVDTVNQIQSQAERDNKFVYFQPVPGPNSTNSSAGLPLPELPAEASVMNPAQYREPDRSAEAPVVLQYVAKPSIFSSMLSSLMAPSASAAPTPADAGAGTVEASAPPAPGPLAMQHPVVPMTDEEYARSLQRQYDTESSAVNQGKGPAPAAAAAPPAPALAPAPAAPRYNSLV